MESAHPEANIVAIWTGLIYMVGSSGIQLVPFFAQLYFKEKGIVLDPIIFGIITLMFMLGQFFWTFVHDIVFSGVERRNVMIVGLLVQATLSFFLSFLVYFDSIVIFSILTIIGRFIFGIGQAIYQSSVYMIIQQTNSHRLRLMLAIFKTMTAFGMGIAPYAYTFIFDSCGYTVTICACGLTTTIIAFAFFFSNGYKALGNNKDQNMEANEVSPLLIDVNEQTQALPVSKALLHKETMVGFIIGLISGEFLTFYQPVLPTYYKSLGYSDNDIALLPGICTIGFAFGNIGIMLFKDKAITNNLGVLITVIGSISILGVGPSVLLPQFTTLVIPMASMFIIGTSAGALYLISFMLMQQGVNNNSSLDQLTNRDKEAIISLLNNRCYALSMFSGPGISSFIDNFLEFRLTCDTLCWIFIAVAVSIFIVGKGKQ